MLATSQDGFIGKVEYLVEHVADINMKNNEGNTHLLMVSKKEDSYIVKL